MPDRPTTDFKVEVTFDAAKGQLAGRAIQNGMYRALNHKDFSPKATK
jgi:hypothetical protein